MRPILILVQFITFAYFSHAQEDFLVGKWENKAKQVTYEFRKDGSLVYKQAFSTAFVNSYELDKSQDPHLLSFTLKSGANTLVIPALLKIINDDEIIIQQFPPLEEPTEFSKEGDIDYFNVHVLKRKQ